MQPRDYCPSCSLFKSEWFSLFEIICNSRLQMKFSFGIFSNSQINSAIFTVLEAELVSGRVTRTPWATRNADCQRLKQYWESIYCIYKPNTVPILVRPAAYWLTVFCSQVELVFHLVTGKPIMGVIFLERRNSNNNSIRRSIDFAIVKTLFWCDDVSFPNHDIWILPFQLPCIRASTYS